MQTQVCLECGGQIDSSGDARYVACPRCTLIQETLRRINTRCPRCFSMSGKCTASGCATYGLDGTTGDCEM